jgi:Asp-tRNA(Asn)/Glu-tRNA(Gln) amidotransferase A subunit family amidase
MQGVVPLCKSFDTVGPITKTVEDAALIFSVITGNKASGFAISVNSGWKACSAQRYGT